MNATLIAAIAVVLLLGLLPLAWNRGAIVFALMLPASDFLGLVDPALIRARGAFDTFAMIMIIVVIALLLGIRGWRELKAATFRWPFVLLTALWAYGLLAPVFRGDSTWSLAVNASKEFMLIMAYPAVFVLLQSQRDVRVAWTTLFSFGIYYSVLEILAQLGGVTFMSLLHYSYRPDDFGLWKLYVQYWPVILVSLLHAVFSSVLRGRVAILGMMLGSIGLLLTFYRSYLLAALVAIPVVLLWARVRIGRSLLVGFTTVGGVVIALGLISFASGYSGPDVSAIGSDLVLSGISELRDDTGGSLAGRRRHAQELLKLASAHPYVGYGFVKQEAQLIQTLHMETFAGGMLGFVDKGNADVLVKFGYAGAAVLYATFLWIAAIAVRRARAAKEPTAAVRFLVVGTLALIYLMVQPVHAPCTYGFALLPFAIAMAIADRAQRIGVKSDRAALNRLS